MSLTFHIQSSSLELCRATATHKSGRRPVEIAAGDWLLGGERGDLPAGLVDTVRATELDEGWWRYEVEYRAMPRTEHRIGRCLMHDGSSSFAEQPPNEVDTGVTGRAGQGMAQAYSATA